MRNFFSGVFLLFVLVAGVYSQSIGSINLKDFRLSSKNEQLFLDTCSFEKIRGRKIYNDGISCLNVSSLEVYVLGWSRDGKVAFLENRSIDGRGGNDLYFTVLDAVNNKLVYFHNFNFYDEGRKCTVKQCVKDNHKFIDEQLSKFKIEFQKSIYVPATEKQDEGSVGFNVNVLKNGSGEYGLNEMTYDVEAIKGNTKKTVGSYSGLCNKVIVTGYLRSPFDNLVAVIVLRSRFVFEGSELELSFYGCDLEKVFK